MDEKQFSTMLSELSGGDDSRVVKVFKQLFAVADLQVVQSQIRNFNIETEKINTERVAGLSELAAIEAEKKKKVDGLEADVK